jgi:hypothetical protein
MARPAKLSLFERKLQDLERQRELIEGDIRTLSKSMRKLDEGGALPPLRSRSAEAAPAPRPAAPTPNPAPAEPPPWRRDAAAARTLDRAFGTLAGDEGATPADDLEAEPDERPVPPPAPHLVVDTRRRASPAPPRFANYFASGSFGTNRPLAEERRIQRHKAIFMVIVVATLLYIAIRFVF